MRVKSKSRTVEAGTGSEDTRKVTLGKEKLSHRKVYTCCGHGKPEVAVPSSHSLLGIRVCRVVVDRAGSKLTAPLSVC